MIRNCGESIKGILTFWGVRGSIPAPGLHTIVFGGNTSCVSVQTRSHLIIFDAGSGIRKLGADLLASGEASNLKGDLFLTHMHWDHIQGLPFFAPAFADENRFRILGEAKAGVRLIEVLRDQMQGPYFPVSMDSAFRANVDFLEIGCGAEIDLGDGLTVKSFRCNHPNDALGYILEICGLKLAYVPDNELDGGPVTAAVTEALQGVDILIHDAQYSRHELANGKKNWGHSAWEDTVDLADAIGARKLYLFHHDPGTTDDDLNVRHLKAQEVFPDTTVAREGLRVPLR